MVAFFLIKIQTNHLNTEKTTMQKILVLIIGFIIIVSGNFLFGKNTKEIYRNKAPNMVKLGIDVLIETEFELIKGKKISLITNQKGFTSQHESTIDVLNRLPNVKLIAVFAAEHGIRGDIKDGEKFSTSVDKRTGIIVYSLYGKMQRPTYEMLRNIDVIIYDMQDIGSRAYTYIYTMAKAMQAAKEQNIEFIVLDRPNPMGGVKVAGNVLYNKFSSYVGLYPIPYIYGMTVGELAKLFNKEFNINCNLTVVPMKGWNR